MSAIVCTRCPNVGLWQWREDNGWQPPGKPLELRPAEFRHSPTNLPAPITPTSQVCVIVASSDKLSSCSSCRQSLTDAFCMPRLWWSGHCRNSNGYFGCESRGTGTVSGFNTWMYLEVKQVTERDKYGWHYVNVFTRWLPSTGQMAIVVFDAQLPAFEGLPDRMLSPDVDCLGDPFWVYACLLDEVFRLQDSAVWAMRDRVRNTEKGRVPKGNPQAVDRPQPDYGHLHDLARHAIHVCETLDVATYTISHIMMHHEAWMISNPSTKPSKNIHRRLRFFESAIGNLRYRSVSNKDRLLNEIQLAFNAVAQHDAGISVDIGLATRSESATMKTIAFITMAFLPPTLICSIFSMSFFNFSDSGWVISDKFWLYWAFAVPTTAATIMSWYFWQRGRFHNSVTQCHGT